MITLACAKCGTENRPGARFCSHCGNPFASTCPNCGAAVDAGAKFCSNCGIDLVAAAATADGLGTDGPGPAAAPPASVEERL